MMKHIFYLRNADGGIMAVLENVAGEWRNQQSTLLEDDSKIAALPNGNYVVVWTEGNTGQNRVVYQILDKGGFPIGDNQLANLTDSTNAFRVKALPDVVVLDDGRFIIGWEQTFGGLNGNGIFTRVFDETGTPLSDSFLAATYSNTISSSRSVQLESAGANEFWVVSGGSVANEGDNIFRQKFDVFGNALTQLSRVNEDFAARQDQETAFEPELVRLDNGNYLVLWTWFIGSQSDGVRARLFDSDFSPLTGDFEVTDRRDASATIPDYRITSFADGGFAVVSAGTQPTAGAIEKIIELNIYNADGSVRVASVPVATFPNTGPASPSIATLANGQLVIGWLENSGSKVAQGAIFDADGNAVISRFDLGDSPFQGDLDLVTKPDGSIAMTYNGSDTQFGGGWSVKAKVLERITSPTITASDDFVLYAANHSPAVNGLGGNDTIVGNTANNTILGDVGNDALYGNAGNDTITGGRGNDELFGGDGDDVFRYATGDGQDDIDGGDGFDTVRAIAANARLQIGSITDVEQISSGGFANVNLFGTAGVDVIDLTGVTLDGIGFIDAGNGNDIVIGTAGDDVFRAGNGADVFTGGEGNDRYVFQGVSAGLASAVDVITDFVQGSDIIDLAGVDANSTTNGNQAFSFIGSSAFSGVAGELRVLRGQNSGITRLQGDTNGDGVADFFIQLTGLYVLTTDDLIL